MGRGENNKKHGMFLRGCLRAGLPLPPAVLWQMGLAPSTGSGQGSVTGAVPCHGKYGEVVTHNPLACLSAHHFIAATACHEAEYGRQIRERCLRPFKLSMEGIGQQLWCDWDETMG